MILPLNKYNLEDLSNTKFYKNITWQNYPKYVRFPKISPSYTNFCMKNNPKYVRSPKKHTLVDQFYMNLIPYSHYTCTVLDCEKKTLFTWISGRALYPLYIQVPVLGVAAKMTSPIWYCFVFLAFTAIFYQRME